MSEEELSAPHSEEAPAIPRRGRTGAWVGTAVLMLISAGWLAFKYNQDRDPMAYVRFQTADSIEAGKTEVRCLGMKVGALEKIDYAADMQSVVLELRIDPDQGNLLRGGSQFWVVRPRISESTITGLGTLISGAYIELKPGDGPCPVNHFDGLERPPTIGAAGVKP